MRSNKNPMLKQRIIELLHQMNDDQLNQIIHFIEKNKNYSEPKKGVGTCLHQQFQAIGLVDAGFNLPERS